MVTFSNGEREQGEATCLRMKVPGRQTVPRAETWAVLQVSFLALNVYAARQFAAREVEGDARELCFQFAVLESRYVATNQCLPEPPSCPEVGRSCAYYVQPHELLFCDP